MVAVEVPEAVLQHCECVEALSYQALPEVSVILDHFPELLGLADVRLVLQHGASAL